MVRKPTNRAPLIFIITGEPSGDFLGARLMAGLKEETGGNVLFDGIGGETMAAEGLTSRVDIGDLAVMGLLEVLPKAPLILRRVREVVAIIEEVKPDAVVTVDSWGFTIRVVQRLKKAGVPCPRIHFVAPMVWAWRANRAMRLARHVHHLMTLLPHEPPLFRSVGLPATCVGHPVIEAARPGAGGEDFRARHGIAEDAMVICVLPGSRRGEVAKLLPVFLEATARLAKAHSNLHLVVPTVATVEPIVRAALEDWPIPSTVVRGAPERYAAFAVSDAAMAASGTVALELACAQVPHVVAYRVSPLTAWAFRRATSLRYVSLVNIALDREVVPELLQEECRGDLVAEVVEELLADPDACARQLDGVVEALTKLGGEDDADVPPGRRAARTVLKVIEEWRATR